ncbi:MAG: lysozyme [Xenococcaceae cyanobacterium]
MNKITYLTSKRLNLTVLAAITSLASLSLTVPLSVNHSQTASFHNLQSSSASVKNQLVNASVKAIEANGDRWQETQESSIKKSNHSSDLESNSLVAVKQAKYMQAQALKLESSLAKTITLVKELEGFRSSAYVDTDGTVVIGYGMPIINGRKVRLGDLISEVQAETALREKLQEIQQQILAASTVELNSHQLVALTSFTFNVGVESVFKSTLLTKLNAGDFFGAANEFPRWNQANMGGRLVPLAGLTKRRLTEKNLFLTAVN